jgi:hypothetical protein
MPSKIRLKILAPIVAGLLIGFAFKGYNGDLQAEQQYDFKKDASASLNKAFGLKPKE